MGKSTINHQVQSSQKQVASSKSSAISPSHRTFAGRASARGLQSQATQAAWQGGCPERPRKGNQEETAKDLAENSGEKTGTTLVNIKKTTENQYSLVNQLYFYDHFQ
jgi:hypothetical protein